MFVQIYSQLKIGNQELRGDVDLASVGGVDVSQNHVQCYRLEWGSAPAAQPSRPGAGRSLDLLRLVKRTDGTTPLLYSAYMAGTLLSGAVKIFDTHPSDGSTRHRTTLTITSGRLVSMHTTVNEADAAPGHPAALDRLELAVAELRVRDEVVSTEAVLRTPTG